MRKAIGLLFTTAAIVTAAGAYADEEILTFRYTAHETCVAASAGTFTPNGDLSFDATLIVHSPYRLSLGKETR